jgi:hypothetical protein
MPADVVVIAAMWSVALILQKKRGNLSRFEFQKLERKKRPPKAFFFFLWFFLFGLRNGGEVPQKGA